MADTYSDVHDKGRGVERAEMVMGQVWFLSSGSNVGVAAARTAALPSTTLGRLTVLRDKTEQYDARCHCKL